MSSFAMSLAEEEFFIYYVILKSSMVLFGDEDLSYETAVKSFGFIDISIAAYLDRRVKRRHLCAIGGVLLS